VSIEEESKPMGEDLAEAARRAIPLVDLTSLNDDDSDEKIAKLCAQAVTPSGSVAAVCIYGRFIPIAKGRLGGTGVRVAAVANFPAGTASVQDTADEVRSLVAAGADEVDVVLPYRELLAGKESHARELLATCRLVCGTGVTLKAILETGAFGEDDDRLAAAAELAIGSGADFLKTSTGKISVGATSFAATCLLEAIRSSGREVGFKASGGIRDTSQAAAYLSLADRIMGPWWATPATFRFGASSLLGNLLACLKANGARRPPVAATALRNG